MADNDLHAGAFSGLAAGILIIALTVMGLFAFQPHHAASIRGSPGDSAVASSAH
jgi:hypothetical protein